MSTTTESIKNYFNSAEKFLDNYMQFMVSMAPEDQKKEAEKAAKQYSEWMHNFLDKFEKTASEQIEKVSNESPEEIQKQNLKALDEFEDGYKKAYQYVLDWLEKQRTYMESDQYLTDLENNKNASEEMYNSSLNSVSKMIDSYADLFKGMK